MSATSTVPTSDSRRRESPPYEWACRLSDDGLGTACVYVAAELDIASAPQLEGVLRRAALRADLVVLDLRELTFMDSSGLHVIVEASNRAQRAGGRLFVLGGPSQVHRLFAHSEAADRVEIIELADIGPAIELLLRTARAQPGMTAIGPWLDGAELTAAISAAMVELYAEFYDHAHTTATTYINDTIVICVVENIVTAGDDGLVAVGAPGTMIDGCVAFGTETENELLAAVKSLTDRRVVTFLSANQTTPRVACDVFFLDPAPAR